MFILLGLLVPILGITGTAIVGVICGIFAYFYFSIKNKQSYWKKKEIKYIEPKFLLGSMKIFSKKPLAERIQNTYKEFPEERYHGFYQFTKPALVIKDPELIKEITVKAFDHFTDHRDFIGEELDPFWARNLFASNGDKWRKMRNTLSPSFTSSKLKIMFGLIKECAEQFVHFFDHQNQKDLKEIEVKELFRRYTNDVIATTAFGIKYNTLENPDNEFYRMGSEVADFSGLQILKIFLYNLSPTLTRLLQVRIIPKKIANYFTDIINDTVKVRQKQNIIRPDMIHLLLEAQHQNKTLTIDDITSQAFIFFLAGFETVSTFLAFTFYELAVDQKIQKRLRKEILENDENITYEKLLEMKYLDMVTSEVLRKWPSMILTDRKVTKPYTIQPKNLGEKPLDLDENAICWLPIYAIQNDPKNFPNPEKFDPERFNDENKHTINPNVYIPFGAGPRSCIGSRFAILEGKLLIYYVLKHFEVVPVGKTHIPMVLDEAQLNLNAKNGMWLGFKKIEK